MKTLFKTYTNHQKALAKRKDFEKKTGLKWQYYSTGDGIRFVPIATKLTPIDHKIAAKLSKFCSTDYQGFVELSQKSGLSLSDTVSGAWSLIKAQTAIPTVCRMGGIHAIRLKQKWEFK